MFQPRHKIFHMTSKISNDKVYSNKYLHTLLYYITLRDHLQTMSEESCCYTPYILVQLPFTLPPALKKRNSCLGLLYFPLYNSMSMVSISLKYIL